MQHERGEGNNKVYRASNSTQLKEIMMLRSLGFAILLCHCTSWAFKLHWPSTRRHHKVKLAMPTTSTKFQPRTVLNKSLFDEDENDSSTYQPRKFTGQDYFSASSSGSGTNSPGTTSSSNNERVSPREQMRQREYNLVSIATSPSAFLFQAASVLVLLVLIIYVGATGYVRPGLALYLPCSILECRHWSRHNMQLTLFLSLYAVNWE